jgi:DNA-binding transcriptional regulator YhcF (GntR family)
MPGNLLVRIHWTTHGFETSDLDLGFWTLDLICGPVIVLTLFGSPNKILAIRNHKLRDQEVSRVKTNIRVNRKRPESMTKQITDQLMGLIESGAYTVGSYLPSERDLANQVNVARNVVRGSYENLMRAGKIQSEGRKGKTVRSAGSKKKAGTKSAAGAKSRKK